MNKAAELLVKAGGSVDTWVLADVGIESLAVHSDLKTALQVSVSDAVVRGKGSARGPGAVKVCLAVEMCG